MKTLSSSAGGPVPSQSSVEDGPRGLSVDVGLLARVQAQHGTTERHLTARLLERLEALVTTTASAVAVRYVRGRGPTEPTHIAVDLTRSMTRAEMATCLDVPTHHATGQVFHLAPSGPRATHFEVQFVEAQSSSDTSDRFQRAFASLGVGFGPGRDIPISRGVTLGSLALTTQVSRMLPLARERTPGAEFPPPYTDPPPAYDTNGGGDEAGERSRSAAHELSTHHQRDDLLGD